MTCWWHIKPRWSFTPSTDQHFTEARFYIALPNEYLLTLPLLSHTLKPIGQFPAFRGKSRFHLSEKQCVQHWIKSTELHPVMLTFQELGNASTWHSALWELRRAQTTIQTQCDLVPVCYHESYHKIIKEEEELIQLGLASCGGDHFQTPLSSSKWTRMKCQTFIFNHGVEISHR